MENLKVKLTEEEIKIVKSILLEHSTFYTKKIVENKTLELKTMDKEFLKEIQSNIDYYITCKGALDKLYYILKTRIEKER